MKNKAISMLVSLAIAFGLWVYVVSTVSQESERTFSDIPVAFSNEVILNDNGLMVMSDASPKVSLSIKGNRIDLNNLKASDISVSVDLSKIDGAGEKRLRYSVSLPNRSFEISNQRPQEITVTVAERATKEVDINLSYVGATPPEYIADTDGVELDYEKVSITGPKEVIDQITQAVIEVDLDGKIESISQTCRYKLCNADGVPVDAQMVQTNVPEIQMTLRILRVKEVQLQLEVAYGGGATNENTNIRIDPMTIKVAGGEKLLESLDSITLGSINLAELLEDKEFTFPINLPEGIENLSGVTEAKVSVQFLGLKSKVITITKILANNNANVAVTLARQDLDVTVRGIAEQIDAMDEQDLYARIDCTNEEMGERKLKAQIFIDTGFDTVGVVGTYYVYATLAHRGGG